SSHLRHRLVIRSYFMHNNEEILSISPFSVSNLSTVEYPRCMPNDSQVTVDAKCVNIE
ncbi:hypothetical protein ScPMuIL_005208, partial [Solemya velum]